MMKSAKDFYISKFVQNVNFSGDKDLKYTKITARWAIEIAEEYAEQDAKDFEVLDDKEVNSFISGYLLSGKNFINCLKANKYLIVKIIE